VEVIGHLSGGLQKDFRSRRVLSETCLLSTMAHRIESAAVTRSNGSGTQDAAKRQQRGKATTTRQCNQSPSCFLIAPCRVAALPRPVCQSYKPLISCADLSRILSIPAVKAPSISPSIISGVAPILRRFREFAIPLPVK